MAVQIPTLKRLGPQEPTSVGRVQTDLPDSTRAVAQTSQALQQVAETTTKYIEEEEKNASDLVATRAAVDYEVKYKTELAKLKAIKGDPTTAYAEFDQKSAEWESEVLTNYEGTSDRTKQAIRERITKSKLLNRDNRAVSEALQYSAFEKNTTDEAVKLEQEGVSEAAETFNAADPNSILGIQMRINAIRDLRIESGRRTKLVTKNEKGEDNYSEALKMQMKEDVSEALKNTIQNLSGTGKTEEAKLLLERYSDQILAKTKASLYKTNEESQAKTQALVWADKLKRLPDDQQLQAAESQIKDVEVRQKAMQFLDDRRRQFSNFKTQAQKDTYEDLARYTAGKNFVSSQQMKDDPIIKQAIEDERISVKQLGSLEKMVEKPASSNPKVMEKYYDAVFDQKLVGMSFGDISEMTAGMSEKHSNAAMKEWEEANKETGAARSKMIGYMGKRLKEKLQLAGGIKKDVYGRYSNKEEIKYLQAKEQLMGALDTLPANASVDVQEKWVDGLVTSYMKKEVFTGLGDVKPRFRGGAPPVQASPVGVKPKDAAEAPTLTPNDRSAWIKKFYLENKAAPKTSKELNDFYKAKGGKL